ncbi:MAG TPA: S-methyl-5'-thioadenosine phosphorylase [bacterium]|nr:S-methyl-5'-thioadenosine phosphorylase [bacterium]
MNLKVGIIGGSGLYDMEALENVQEVAVPTPFGDPADKLITGVLKGVDVVFLPRHGRGHRFTPTEVPYRANVWAMKKLGVTHIISVSACGSLKEEHEPGRIVVIDQLLDRTRHRKDTFFEGGIVAHVPFGDPICMPLAKLLYDAGVKLDLKMAFKGAYLCMEGPQFSTRAESFLYRSWGMDVIGMTNYTEARLAREAEICYATLALVTDYDCWKEHEEGVDALSVLEVMAANVKNAKAILLEVIDKIPAEPVPGYSDVLSFSIVTNAKVVPDKVKQDLEPIIGKYMK